MLVYTFRGGVGGGTIMEFHGHESVTSALRGNSKIGVRRNSSANKDADGYSGKRLATDSAGKRVSGSRDSASRRSAVDIPLRDSTVDDGVRRASSCCSWASSDSTEQDITCPLCMENLDETDRGLYPCECGYQVCLWCLHHIRDHLGNKCPACRRDYDEKKFKYDQSRINELSKQIGRKSRDKHSSAAEARNTSSGRGNSLINSVSVVTSCSSGIGNAVVKASVVSTASGLGGKSGIHSPANLAALKDVRVIQRSLAYVIGIPPSIAKKEILKGPEYFGQYGKVVHIVINKSQGYNSHWGGPSYAVYVTYSSSKEAIAAIQGVDGAVFEGRTLKASFGTTKYCSYFLKGAKCQNPDCFYLHHIGCGKDSFTKEAMISAKHQFLDLTFPAPGDAKKGWGANTERSVHTFGRLPETQHHAFSKAGESDKHVAKERGAGPNSPSAGTADSHFPADEEGSGSNVTETSRVSSPLVSSWSKHGGCGSGRPVGVGASTHGESTRSRNVKGSAAASSKQMGGGAGTWAAVAAGNLKLSNTAANSSAGGRVIQPGGASGAVKISAPAGEMGMKKGVRNEHSQSSKRNRSSAAAPTRSEGTLPAPTAADSTSDVRWSTPSTGVLPLESPSYHSLYASKSRSYPHATGSEEVPPLQHLNATPLVSAWDPPPPLFFGSGVGNCGSLEAGQRVVSHNSYKSDAGNPWENNASKPLNTSGTESWRQQLDTLESVVGPEDTEFPSDVVSRSMNQTSVPIHCGQPNRGVNVHPFGEVNGAPQQRHPYDPQHILLSQLQRQFVDSRRMRSPGEESDENNGSVEHWVEGNSLVSHVDEPVSTAVETQRRTSRLQRSSPPLVRSISRAYEATDAELDSRVATTGAVPCTFPSSNACNSVDCISHFTQLTTRVSGPTGTARIEPSRVSKQSRFAFAASSGDGSEEEFVIPGLEDCLQNLHVSASPQVKRGVPVGVLSGTSNFDVPRGGRTLLDAVRDAPADCKNHGDLSKHGIALSTNEGTTSYPISSSSAPPVPIRAPPGLVTGGGMVSSSAYQRTGTSSFPYHEVPYYGGTKEGNVLQYISPCVPDNLNQENDGQRSLCRRTCFTASMLPFVGSATSSSGELIFGPGVGLSFGGPSDVTSPRPHNGAVAKAEVINGQQPPLTKQNKEIDEPTLLIEPAVEEQQGTVITGSIQPVVSIVRSQDESCTSLGENGASAASTAPKDQRGATCETSHVSPGTVCAQQQEGNIGGSQPGSTSQSSNNMTDAEQGVRGSRFTGSVGDVADSSSPQNGGVAYTYTTPIHQKSSQGKDAKHSCSYDAPTTSSNSSHSVSTGGTGSSRCGQGHRQRQRRPHTQQLQRTHQADAVEQASND